MFAIDQLNHEARMRKANERLVRGIRFFCFISISLIMTFYFAVAGWLAANTTAPSNSDMADWLWTYCWVTMAMTCLFGAGWFAMKAFDELLPTNSTRRIMRSNKQ